MVPPAPLDVAALGCLVALCLAEELWSTERRRDTALVTEQYAALGADHVQEISAVYER